MSEQIVTAFAIGIGATLVMDLVALGLKYGVGLQSLNYALVGRWCLSLAGGAADRRPVPQRPAIRGEVAIGWGLHYLIGVIFAGVFLAWAGDGWLSAPAPVPALGFGVLTVLAPFLVLQPGLGAGLAARRTSHPWAARAKSLLAHLSFGAGLWLAGVGWSALV
ncbi:DUF2938 family protein [Pseudodonghicola flavimaris]|uniref:DUF2938 family protein n=1 Tax=Pseudodonghicola flavimaris TaxID=3050036 RepID=A0ABT7F208_9RHOB|nr:DUF2938 family protein [Pseudodonghicola flavimaris]MDK3018631.1 DUF2938 family protein [Pseudodonghicola flavimaris]